MDEPQVVESRVRVRYAETDAEGVVYYANHFVYMEVGRVNYFRSLGFDPASLDHTGRGIVIIEATCRYRSPARFDDPLLIRAWVDAVKRSSFEFAYEIWHEEDNRLIAEGRTVQVIVDLQTMRPIRIPQEMRAAMATALGP
jgi:acyl-CoA thioester hydrolase